MEKLAVKKASEGFALFDLKIIDGETKETVSQTVSEFGFEATLNINVGTEYSGKYGNLYYFNDGFLEFISAAKVDVNGNASLAFTHASDYAIVISDEASVTPNDTPANTSPDTGDHSHLGIYTLVAVIAVAGITSTIIYKKKAFEK